MAENGNKTPQQLEDSIESTKAQEAMTNSVTGLSDAVENINKTIVKFDNSFDKFSGRLFQKLDSLGGSLTKFDGAIKKFAGDTGRMGSGMVAAQESFLSRMTGALSRIMSKIGSVISKVSEGLSKLAGKIKDVAGNLAPKLDKMIRKIDEGVGKFVDKMKAAVGNLAPKLDNMIRKIDDGVGKFVDKIKVAVSNLGPKLSGIVSKIGTGISKFVDNVKLNAPKLFASFKTAAGKFATNLEGMYNTFFTPVRKPKPPENEPEQLELPLGEPPPQQLELPLGPPEPKQLELPLGEPEPKQLELPLGEPVPQQLELPLGEPVPQQLELPLGPPEPKQLELPLPLPPEREPVQLELPLGPPEPKQLELPLPPPEPPPVTLVSPPKPSKPIKPEPPPVTLVSPPKPMDDDKSPSWFEKFRGLFQGKGDKEETEPIRGPEAPDDCCEKIASKMDNLAQESTLREILRFAVQISDNVYNIAGHLGAQVTSLQESSEYLKNLDAAAKVDEGKALEEGRERAGPGGKSPEMKKAESGLDKLAKFLDTIFTVLVPFFVGFLVGLVDIKTTFGKLVLAAGLLLVLFRKEFVGLLMKGVKGLFGSIFGGGKKPGIPGIPGGPGGPGMPGGPDATGPAGNAVGKLDKLGATLKKIGSGIKTFVIEFVKTITTVMKELADGIGKVLKTLSSAISSSLKSIGQGLSSFIKSVAGGLEKLLKSIAKGIESFGNTSVLKGAAALLVVAGALYVAGKAFKEFNQVDWESVGKGFVAIGGLVVVAKLLGGSTVHMIKGAAALLIMSGALYVAGKAFQQFINIDFKTLGVIAVAIAGLALALVGLGMILPLVTLGSVALGVMSVALLAFGAALNVVAAALPTMQSFLETVSMLDGTQLLVAAAGITALGLSLVALGGGAVIGALGDFASKILSFGKDDIFTKLIKLGRVAKDLNKLPGTIKALGELSNFKVSSNFLKNVDILAQGLKKIAKAAEGFEDTGDALKALAQIAKALNQPPPAAGSRGGGKAGAQAGGPTAKVTTKPNTIATGKGTEAKVSDLTREELIRKRTQELVNEDPFVLNARDRGVELDPKSMYEVEEFARAEAEMEIAAEIQAGRLIPADQRINQEASAGLNRAMGNEVPASTQPYSEEDLRRADAVRQGRQDKSEPRSLADRAIRRGRERIRRAAAEPQAGSQGGKGLPEGAAGYTTDLVNTNPDDYGGQVMGRDGKVVAVEYDGEFFVVPGREAEFIEARRGAQALRQQMASSLERSPTPTGESVAQAQPYRRTSGQQIGETSQQVQGAASGGQKGSTNVSSVNAPSVTQNNRSDTTVAAPLVAQPSYNNGHSLNNRHSNIRNF